MVLFSIKSFNQFSGFFFTFLFLMECAGCLYNFVQMAAEPGKAVAAIDV
jgi:hypothetical protein